MNSKTKKLKRILALLYLIPFIVTAVSMRYLPETVPMHYDSLGNVDRWGSKYEFWVAGLLLSMVCLSWITIAASVTGKAKDADNDKAKAEAEINEHSILMTGIALAPFFGAIQYSIIHSAFVAIETGTKLPASELVMIPNIILSLVLIVMGNIMPKIRKNQLFGLRVSWSMYNDNTWVKSQRVCGIILIIAGGLSLIVSLLIKTFASTFIILGIIIAATIATLIAAYKIYNAELAAEASADRS